MTPEERELRRALDARSGEPSAEFRARLSNALEAGRPATRTTPTFALIAAACLAIAIVGVLMLTRLGPHMNHGGPASGVRSQVTPSPATEAAIDSVAMFGDSGWAVALDSDNQIADLVRTADGGRTWRVVTPKGTQGSFIFGAAPIDDSRAWLMAAQPSQEGTGPVDLWATSDRGETWSKTTAPGFMFRGSLITFTDGTHGWFAVPGQPMSQEQQQGIVIDRTVDGGKTWHLVAETNWPPAKSTRGAPPLTCGKSSLSFLNATTGWLTGGCTGGITFDATTDGGVTWKAQPLPGPHGLKFVTACEGGPCSLSAPRFLSPAYGYMVLNDTSLYPVRSWLYVSRDGGTSWSNRSLPGDQTSVTMLTQSVGFASAGPPVDSTGVADSTAPWLYRTDDGGNSWSTITANVQLPYAALDCASTSRCWALSTSPIDSSTRLYETTDGGRTWSQVAGPRTQPTPPPSPVPQTITGVIEKPPAPIALPASAQLSAPSTNVIWALMVNQYLYRSTDRGATWQQEPLPPSKDFCPAHVSPCPYPLPTEISFVSDKEGWFMPGESGQPQCNTPTIAVWHTTDAGATWQWLGSKGIAPSQCTSGLSFVDSNHGFLSAWEPKHPPVIYRTTDGGRTWTPSQPVPTPPFKTVCLDCIAMQAGIVRTFGSTLLVPVWQQSGSTDRYVFRSTDGGATWTYVTTGAVSAFVTGSRWLWLSNSGEAIETTDAGASWHKYITNYAEAAPIAADFVFGDSLVGYATVRGGISRTVDGGLHWTHIETPGTGIKPTG